MRPSLPSLTEAHSPDVTAYGDQTRLLATKPPAFRWDVARWTVGVHWYPKDARLSLCILPCVSLDFHLPGRRTREKARRWWDVSGPALLFGFAVTLIAVSAGIVIGWTLRG